MTNIHTTITFSGELHHPEIDRLRAESAKLRAAVSWLASLDMDRFTEHDVALLEAAIDEARAALTSEKEEGNG